MQPANLKRSLRRLGSTLVMLLAALVVIVVGELLPPLKAFQQLQDSNPQLNRALLVLTIAMTAAGTFLLAFTQFLVRVPDRRKEHSAAISPGENQGWSRRFFNGVTASAGFHDEAHVWQVKRALRNGDWWRVPRWRRFTLMGLGAALLFYGLFGLIFILATPGIKLLIVLVVVYGTVRTIWAFGQDRPFRETRGEEKGEKGD